MGRVELKGKTVLVTGAAGFIGSHLVKRLCGEEDVTVVGLDSMDGRRGAELKKIRLAELSAYPSFAFVRGSIADRDVVERVFGQYRPRVAVNLAARAGVRDSITCPDACVESNLIGFYNILEACRHAPVEHLVYASSSSVYGDGGEAPCGTEDRADRPVSLYAAAKRSNELMAHAYAKLYSIPATGLRFFTVYGPAGRPDMAYFSFTDRLRAGRTIRLFNYGNCKRDFTYVDDVVEGIVRVMQRAPDRETGEDGLPVPPWALYNIGSGRPETLLDFVTVLREELVRAGVLPEDCDLEGLTELAPMQPGDVAATCADTSALERDFGFRPRTGLREGLRKFAEWYQACYGNARAGEEGDDEKL